MDSNAFIMIFMLYLYFISYNHYFWSMKVAFSYTLCPPTPDKHYEDSHSQMSTEGDQTDFNHHFHHPTCFSVPSSKVKTSLCKNYIEKGMCPYGERCQFAHGTHQLRINMQQTKCYKTKECFAFHKQGYCQYGQRCNFIHFQNYHGSLNSHLTAEEKRQKMMENHRETILEARMPAASRLLRMLEGGSE